MRNFIKASLFGGFLVILPIAIMVFFFKWLVTTITNLIRPLTDFVGKFILLPDGFVVILVLVLILTTCFFVGIVVKTKLGTLLHEKFDNVLQRMAPGYRMVKEVVVQVFDRSENSPFSNGQVALVKAFGEQSPTEMTALVTDRHADGSYTVFVPTGPNPTSGFVFHVQASQVTLRPDVKIDSAMRTIISCGAGSATLFNKVADI